MAAFVVVARSDRADVRVAGMQLNIFPGSATPAVFQADAPFWIGYGFVRDPGEPGGENLGALDQETRFELEVDGESVPVVTDLQIEGGRTVSKLSVASFRSGLPTGWHRIAGRWYDAGALVLTSDRSIQFVERS
jgi:hypothetical protein